MSSRGPVALIGGGLAGCLLATLLGRRGYEVTVFERRPDPRTAGAERGRSFSGTLRPKRMPALPMRGRMVHPVHGEPNLQLYSADGRRAINSISRSGLNLALLEAAEATPGVRVEFRHRLTGLWY